MSWLESLARLYAFGDALGSKSEDVCDPNIPEQDRFILPMEMLNASNAASARARGVTLPWKQHTGAA